MTFILNNNGHGKIQQITIEKKNRYTANRIKVVAYNLG